MAVIGVSLLFLPTCDGEDEDSVCGNGVLEAGEECDRADFGDSTCAEALGNPAAIGDLQCSSDCTVQAEGCYWCGDGTVSGEEECDCGTDLANLPDHCIGPNATFDTNCSADCLKIPYCGDGVVDEGEQCDCGMVPDLMPASCEYTNGDPDSTCDEDCKTAIVCESGLWEQCYPLVEGQCCPDDSGANTECVTSPGLGSGCTRSCSETEDCHWSFWCDTDSGGICWPMFCGWDSPETETNQFCTVIGGGQGWCAPTVGSRDLPTDQMLGLCVEAGTAEHGEVCTRNLWRVGDGFQGLNYWCYPIFPGATEPGDWMCADKYYFRVALDRSEVACNLGICFAPQGEVLGACHQFCDWEAAYSDAIYGTSNQVLPCPPGANCWGESRIDDTTGLRQRYVSYCYEMSDRTTCSLVTSQLLSDPSQTCADFMA
ncbi:hypothetical protein ACFL51_01405, partial [Myxococcota bacterium]